MCLFTSTKKKSFLSRDSDQILSYIFHDNDTNKLKNYVKIFFDGFVVRHVDEDIAETRDRLPSHSTCPIYATHKTTKRNCANFLPYFLTAIVHNNKARWFHLDFRPNPAYLAIGMIPDCISKLYFQFSQWACFQDFVFWWFTKQLKSKSRIKTGKKDLRSSHSNKNRFSILIKSIFIYDLLAILAFSVVLISNEYLVIKIVRRED